MRSTSSLILRPTRTPKALTLCLVLAKRVLKIGILRSYVIARPAGFAALPRTTQVSTRKQTSPKHTNTFLKP